MTLTPETRDVHRFRSAIAQRIGLSFDDAKLGFLADVLARRLGASGRSLASYLGLLEGPEPAREEIASLATELTVPETYFFRNGDQLRALCDVVVPERIAARSSAKTLRVLSGGCASGEEPYSLAILLWEHVNDGWDVSIRAIDINAAMLEKATSGRYSRWSLRETPEEMQRRWFVAEGGEYAIREDLRGAVVFEQRNLIADDPDLYRHDHYDVIFCRNVIMYFTAEKAKAVVDRLTKSLVPGGYLFLGHAETLRGLSTDYHLCHTHGTFYYQRKTRLENGRDRREGTSSIAPEGEPRPSDVAFAGGAAAIDPAASWVDTIRGAAERIEALTSPVHEPEQAPSAPQRGDAMALPLAMQLLEVERFSAALDVLGSLPAGAARDADVLLLRAALLSHSGHLGPAEEACHELLAIDELSAGAHYLLALCREGAGATNEAAQHDQVAAYLDPGFAMPRLHLGLLARRAGDRESARRELAQALLLLEREEASRLLLFGGGFSRDALMALCRSEIVACGGRA